MNLLQLSSQNTEKMQTAHALSNLGLLQFADGRIQEAKALHQEALELRKSLESTHGLSEDIEYLAWDMNREFTSTHHLKRNHSHLISRLQQHDSIDALISDSLNNLGGCLELAGDYEEALQMYSEAFELRRVLFGDANVLTAEVMQNIATVQSALGNLKQAAETLESALKIYETHYGADSAESAVILNNLGVVKTQIGMIHDALDCLQKSYDIRVRELGDNHPLTMNSKQNLQYTQNKMTSTLVAAETPPAESTEGNFTEEKYPFCK